MKIVKLLARGILIFFMLPVVLKLAERVLGLVAAFSQSQEVLMTRIGELIGNLLILALLAWLFIKIPSDTPKKK